MCKHGVVMQKGLADKNCRASSVDLVVDKCTDHMKLCMQYT